MMVRLGRGPGYCRRAGRQSTWRSPVSRDASPRAATLDAATRALVYIAKAERRVEERTFDALRKLLLAHPEVSPADFKTALREQWAILTIDERAAIETLPQLLPLDAAERRSLLDNVHAIVTAAGNLGADGRRRLREIEELFETDAGRGSATPTKGHVAAERSAELS